MKKMLILLTTMMVSQSVSAADFYPYNELLLKDLEQMSSLISKKIKEYESQGVAESGDEGMDAVADLSDEDSSSADTSQDITPLKEALQGVYSRPNLDDMIQKVIAPLRSSLESIDSWEKAVSQLIDEALANLKNPKKVKPQVQATYAIMLNNFVNELKIYAGQDGFEKKMLEKIQKADISLSKEAKSEIKLRVLKEPTSPSELAEASLKAAAKAQKDKKKTD